MSVGSQLEPPPAPQDPPQPARKKRTVFLKWHKWVLGVCFAVFALELGVFLIVFPWLSSWDLNWVPLQSPELRVIWMSRYFRGGLTGLGLVNVYVGIGELARQVRALFR